MVIIDHKNRRFDCEYLSHLVRDYKDDVAQ